MCELNPKGQRTLCACRTWMPLTSETAAALPALSDGSAKIRLHVSVAVFSLAVAD